MQRSFFDGVTEFTGGEKNIIFLLM